MKFQIALLSTARVEIPESFKAHLPEIKKLFRNPGKMIFQEFVLDKMQEADEQDGSRVVADLERFSDDHKIKSIFIEGLAEDREMFDIFLKTLPKIVSDQRFVKTQKIDSIISSKNPVTAHTDGSNNTHLLILAGKESLGSVRTYTVEIEPIYQKLTPQTKEILESDIFCCDQKDYYNKTFGPIFYHDQNRRLRVNYFKNDNKSGGKKLHLYQVDHFSIDEIEGALDEFSHLVNQEHAKENLESFHIKTGSILLIKNQFILHGRDGETKDKKESRKVISIGYEDESEKLDLEKPSPSFWSSRQNVFKFSDNPKSGSRETE